MPKDNLLKIIIIRETQTEPFKSKKEETKETFYKPTRINLFKLKREKIKIILNKPEKKNLFKSKIKRNDLKKNCFELEDPYKRIRIGNAFSSKYIEYKSNGDKYKSL